ncbi:MAG: homocysteine S-methyltransferase family protein [Planctomycetia bacterium]|nr:homocysteine S-methyltransferase family protein [Planctomycetia bacterium]
MKLKNNLIGHTSLLMEGGLEERLRREYGFSRDEKIHFTALVRSEAGRKALAELWNQYLAIARRYHLPFLAATPTRRANQERLFQAGEDFSLVRENVAFLREIQATSGWEMAIGGTMGCRGDAYTGEGALSENEAYDFHQPVVENFHVAGIDYFYPVVLPTLPEAVGMLRAIAETEVPSLIGLTIQRDGRLIDGTPIHEALDVLDHATAQPPLGYLANCIHPSLAFEALSQPFNQTELVRRRFIGIQVNTSALSYAELDGATELQTSEPEALAEETLRLKERFGLRILGGCCGTDQRHMEAMACRMEGLS